MSEVDILEELKFHADLWDDNEDQGMSVFFVRCLGEIRGLRQQLQSEKESNEGWQQQALEDEAALQRELAESQAREKVLRDALKAIALRPWHTQVRHVAHVAMSQPTDDTALKALLRAERERCVSAVRNARAGVHPMDAIWALGD